MRANLAQLQGKALPARLRPAKTHPKPLLVDKLIEGSEVERKREKKSQIPSVHSCLVQRPASNVTLRKDMSETKFGGKRETE